MASHSPYVRLHILRKTIGKIFSSLRFTSSNAIGRAPPPAALGQWAGGGRAARNSPRVTPYSPAAPGDDRNPSLVQISIYTSTTPTIRGRKPSYAEIDTASHGVETAIPRADR